MAPTSFDHLRHQPNLKKERCYSCLLFIHRLHMLKLDLGSIITPSTVDMALMKPSTQKPRLQLSPRLHIPFLAESRGRKKIREDGQRSRS